MAVHIWQPWYGNPGGPDNSGVFVYSHFIINQGWLCCSALLHQFFFPFPCMFYPPPALNPLKCSEIHWLADTHRIFVFDFSFYCPCVSNIKLSKVFKDTIVQLSPLSPQPWGNSGLFMLPFHFLAHFPGIHDFALISPYNAQSSNTEFLAQGLDLLLQDVHRGHVFSSRLPSISPLP